MYAAALPPTTWARECARDSRFPLRWLRQNGRARPSPELQEFLGMIFRVKYPSVSNGWHSGATDVRASAAELLQSAWLSSGVATDKEWAEELVRRNAPRVRIARAVSKEDMYTCFQNLKPMFQPELALLPSASFLPNHFDWAQAQMHPPTTS